jgi:predicted Ser/Thr protein kinase
MNAVKTALNNLDENMSEQESPYPVSFEEFLHRVRTDPEMLIRNIFQVFHDMVKTYVGEGIVEHPDETDETSFVHYDCSRLFVEGADRPFFADRLFANRLIKHVESMKRGAQQNKIYIFDGPPGCGKSTFLNNLLMKLETFANTEAGQSYEVVWRLNLKTLGAMPDGDNQPLIEKLSRLLANETKGEMGTTNGHRGDANGEIRESPTHHHQVAVEGDHWIEIPCPSHDNPVMLIPKAHRRQFFNDLFDQTCYRKQICVDKGFEWLFEDSPCTVCTSLYEALLRRLGRPGEVFKMIFARPYRFNRRLGEGISVYNPGDRPTRQIILTHPLLQRHLDAIFKGIDPVRYAYSTYAKTNNGVYGLMDIKTHNTDRLIELHNIISEGVHKVEDMEENVNSLFLAVMNPEDKKNVQTGPSFSDRIEYIRIPYVLDLKTEVDIYRDIFGQHIDTYFLPRVLRNFARVIISSRLNEKSEALLEWIGDPEKYKQYCDKNLQLLKMEIYMGRIPPWLTDEDRKRFTRKRQHRIFAESEIEGNQGFSGRDSIKIFNEFHSQFAKADKPINMLVLHRFFTRIRPDLNKLIPEGFLDALTHLYNFKILQEVKESLYYYNEEQIARDIQNYLFALNFETGTQVVCTFTGERIEVTNAFFESIENRLLGGRISDESRIAFRQDTQKEYTSKTLTQEIIVEGKPITESQLYQNLRERYVYNLKEKVLDPFLENENFRRAIKDYDLEAFKTYDRRIQDDVQFLMKNLCEKFEYTPKGAREICMYVVDNELAKEF